MVRSGPAELLSVLRLLRRDGLLEERGAQISVLYSDGDTLGNPESWRSLERIDELLSQAEQRGTRVVTISGLRTSETFPNLFEEYANDERAMSAYLRLCAVCGSTGASRGFEMEFSEVDFLADDPRISPALLQRRLEEIVGAPLAPSCFGADPEELGS